MARKALLEEKKRIKKEKKLSKKNRFKKRKSLKREKKFSKKIRNEPEIQSLKKIASISDAEFNDLVEKIIKKNMLKTYPDINKIPN